MKRKVLFLFAVMLSLWFTGCIKNDSPNGKLGADEISSTVVANKVQPKVEDEPIEELVVMEDLDVISADAFSTSNKGVIPARNDSEVKFVPSKKVTIFGMKSPLPAKYNKYITSSQGLRNSIPNVNAGGGATLATYHNAIDFACPDKTPVYAVKDGYVQTVWPSYYNGPYAYKGHEVYGGLVEIKHSDNTITLYAHLSMTEVKEGEFVEAGQEIAKSGGVKGRRGSGNSTGPHLHFAVYLDIESLFENE